MVSKIVDRFGNPIETQTLTEPQTARVGSLHQEFDTHPVRGLTPSKLAAIMQDAEQGNLIAQNDLFEDMEEKDGHILAEMGKRKRAVVGLQWSIKPPRNPTPEEEKVAAYAQEVISDIAELDEIIVDMLDAIGKGYSCSEIDWQMEGREWLPGDIDHRPARWFTVDRETRTELRLRDMSLDGQPLQPFTWITHVHKAKSGYITRAGLGRVLAWPFLFKNYSVRDLAEFLEIYGLPLRLGTYPSGASDTEKSTLLSAVVNIGHAAAGIIPEGMMIDFKEAAKGTEGPFNSMLEWCERIESKAIVGQTLSAEAKATGMGSGVANLQGEVRWDLTVADARQIAGTLTRDLVFPIVALNKGVNTLRRAPRFVFDTAEAEDITIYSEALPKLVDAGMRIPVAWAHDRLRIPEAGDKEAVLISKATPATPPQGQAAAHAIAVLKGAPSEVADPLATQLDGAAEPTINDWLDRIRHLVETAPDLATLRNDLLAAYGDLPTEDLASVMQLGFAVADLTGRFDVAEETGALKGAGSAGTA